MLVSFKVSNYRSFHNEVEFSLISNKSSDKDAVQGNPVMEQSPLSNFSLLKCALIYGPNASGKSNLFRALRALKNLLSRATVMPGDFVVEYEPFALDAASSTRPCDMELRFLLEGVLYRYVISFNWEILKECLYSYPKKHEVMLFERTNHVRYEALGKDRFKRIDESSFFVGDSLLKPGEIKKINERTLRAIPFLTKAAQENHPIFGQIWSQITRSIHFGDETPNSAEQMLLNSPTYRAAATALLRGADTGIKQVGINETYQIKSSELFEKYNEIMNELNSKRVTLKELKAGSAEKTALKAKLDAMHVESRKLFNEMTEKQQNISFEHDLYRNDEKFGTMHFSLTQESYGTGKLYGLAPHIIDVLLNGGTLFVDDLGDGLHPEVIESLVGLFNSSYNHNGAQLIGITHMDSILACEKLLRRDQIWFVEKSQKGASTIYSLDHFSRTEVRKGISVQDWYRDNRFGAVPRIDFHEFMQALDNIDNNELKA